MALSPAAQQALLRRTGRNTGPRTRPDGDDPVKTPRDDAISPHWAQHGDRITQNSGVGVDDTDNSLTAGGRGPTLMEDFHLREKIMHFDHERIPERVVHARGSGAHGVFEVTNSLADLTTAGFLGEVGTATPVFVRFSTVAGSRGSADTARDVRGFAVRFYTDQGNLDLVGNNIPVFFIQDGVKFPDVVHAAKPEPDREIPQAQTAHDTFWDFVSLTPESTHMLMWIMSDRAIPRSFRTMEGFGVHTFRLVNAARETVLVKFHWKPVAGVHSLVWDEAQKLGGIDPDFHRRDLWTAIDTGQYPQWRLGVQVFPDTPDQTFEGIDLLDPTKIVPEELAPVREVGLMTLDRNPTNFFDETEQVAFHLGHLVPGIDVTNDPLLQARLFSYLDTQLSRLGGPNFDQLPINRPRAAVNNVNRDGFSQQAVHTGRAAYAPNSVGGGCPYASPDAGAYVHVPAPVEGVKEKLRPKSFSDHYSQATLFWASMSEIEKQHIADAFAFELGKCDSDEVVTRQLANLANVDTDLVTRVAGSLGLPVPAGSPVSSVTPSPALSQIPPAPGPIQGRIVGVLAAPDADESTLSSLAAALGEAGALLHVISEPGGMLKPDIPVHKTLLTAASVDLDALIVADGAATARLAAKPKAVMMLQEAFAHAKPVGGIGAEGRAALEAAGIPLDAPGVVTGDAGDGGLGAAVVTAVGWHRHWARHVV